MHRLAVALVLIAAGFMALVCPSHAQFGQLAQVDWPKFKRDMRNSGCSPATAVAWPTAAWQLDLAAASGLGTARLSEFSRTGACVDSSSVYLLDSGNGCYYGHILGAGRSGSYLWTSPVQTANRGQTRGGMALWTFDGQTYLVQGPGNTSPNVLNFINPSTGQRHLPTISLTTDHESDDAPATGPDGTIYVFAQRVLSSEPPAGLLGYYKGGTIYAVNGATRQTKWSWGTRGSVAGGKSLGYHHGGFPTTVDPITGKTLIIVSMMADNADLPSASWAYAGRNLFCLQDDGATCTVRWAVRTNFAQCTPTLSNDGRTLYVAAMEKWKVAPPAGENWTDTLYAYSIPDGSLKWSINTQMEMMSSPSVGADGTVYITSSSYRNQRVSPGGRVMAIRDDGALPTVKWSLPLDFMTGYSMTCATVTSGSPPVLYAGMGCGNSGRIYAIRDNGSSAEVLWYRGFSGQLSTAADGSYRGTHVQYTPTAPVLGDDGTLYFTVMNTLYAFPPGFDGRTTGISGIVTDKQGNPIPDAFVGASTGPQPLADYSGRSFAKTDGAGRYRLCVPAGAWNVAAWSPGWRASAMKTITLATDISAATADLELTPAGANCARAGTPSAGSGTEIAASTAIDGNPDTAYTSPTGVSLATVPDWVTVDLGGNRSIGEIVLKWGWDYAEAYRIQCLPDGVSPALEANWAGATTVFSTTSGNGGVPITYYGPESENMVGQWRVGADVISIPATTGRYWRVTGTRGGVSRYMTVREFELYDSRPVGPENGRCSGVRTLVDGAEVVMSGKRITAVGGAGGISPDFAYVADSDRVSGIRLRVPGLVFKDIGIGDEVSIIGTAATSGGAKYVEVTDIRKTGTLMPLGALGMANRSAAEAGSRGMFVKTWGRVTGIGADHFMITDGSMTPLRVQCGQTRKPAVNRVVRVRGIADGANLLMRNEAADWTYGEEPFHPLPFPGRYRYPREWLVLGPFKDPSQPHDGALMDVDFIRTATGVDEFAARPRAGEAVGGRVWTRVCSPFDMLAIDSALAPEDVEHSVVYVHLYVWSAVDNPWIYLATGSDDWLRVWVNGDDPNCAYPEVLRVDHSTCPTGRGAVFGDDGPVQISLRQGLNSIMFKVVNQTALASLCCQFVPYSVVNVTGYGGYAPYTSTGLGYVISP